MHELASPQEEKQIPADWNIPGRGNCTVKQLDVAQRFVSVAYPSQPGIEPHQPYKGEYADYFIGPDGERESGLRHSCFDTFVDTKGDGVNMSYEIHEWQSGEHSNANLRVIFKQIAPPKIPIPTEMLGQVLYEASDRPYAKLYLLGIGEVFHPSDTEPSAPDVLLGKKHGTNGLIAEEWEKNPIGNNNGFETIPVNITSVAFKKDGLILYRFLWEIKDGKLIAKQIDYLSGEIKTIAAPLLVNMKPVGDAIFTRAPYQKDPEGFYEVPWTNLGRLVDARISYEAL